MKTELSGSNIKKRICILFKAIEVKDMSIQEGLKNIYAGPERRGDVKRILFVLKR